MLFGTWSQAHAYDLSDHMETKPKFLLKWFLKVGYQCTLSQGRLQSNTISYCDVIFDKLIRGVNLSQFRF